MIFILRLCLEELSLLYLVYGDLCLELVEGGELVFASYATDKFYGELCVVEVAFEVDEVYFEGESVVVVDGGACADVGYAFVLASLD